MDKRNHCEFDHIFLDAVDYAFSCLGESAKTSIYFHLETQFKISRKDIPVEVEAFSDALEHLRFRREAS
jgi:hypothetical protein